MIFKKLAKIFESTPEQAGPRAWVGVFGKHPGWDDHLDDQGLETERLVSAKRVLYTEGIGGNIDSGAWDKLAEGQRLAEFDHTLVWRCGAWGGGGVDGWIVGRIWSSRDGKGRTKYPMIAACEVAGLGQAGADFAVRIALPRLLKLEQECKQATKADPVRLAIEAARNEIRTALAAYSPASAPAGPGAIEGLGQRDELRGLGEGGGPGIGLLRILYEVERETEAFRPGSASLRKSRMVDARAKHVRTPGLKGLPVGGSARLWCDVVGLDIDPSTPILAMEYTREDGLAETGGGLVDVVVSDPSVGTLLPMRQGLTALPLASAVPYTMDEAFIARAKGGMHEILWRGAAGAG